MLLLCLVQLRLGRLEFGLDQLVLLLCLVQLRLGRLEFGLGQLVLLLCLVQLRPGRLQFGLGQLVLLLCLVQLRLGRLQFGLGQLVLLLCLVQLRLGRLQLLLGLLMLCLLFVQGQCVPSKGVALFFKTPTAGMLLQDAAVPRRPVIGMLGITKVRGAQALAVSGANPGHMGKRPEVAELAPEVPIFQYRQGLIKLRAGGQHNAAAEQHSVDG